jgi:hypothetical protein
VPFLRHLIDLHRFLDRVLDVALLVLEFGLLV